LEKPEKIDKDIKKCLKYQRLYKKYWFSI
jgi:hypothetical protein